MSRSFNRRRPTEVERTARRQADRARLEEAAGALLTSDGWQRWVKARATNGLARYSLRNQWLIALDGHRRGITPTYVAGFRAFLTLNRCVRKGERALKILAPVVVKQADNGDENPEERICFRTVFDVSQTEPLPGTEPVSLLPPSQPIAGDSHAHLLAPVAELARELGYTVAIRALPEAGPRGWCDSGRKQIVVAAGRANRRLRTLVHELAHALGVGYEQYGRERAEVLVDCVTYIVCASVGLDVGGEAIAYVAGWGEHDALEAIREYAGTIDTVARRIDTAVAGDRTAGAEDERLAEPA